MLVPLYDVVLVSEVSKLPFDKIISVGGF